MAQYGESARTGLGIGIVGLVLASAVLDYRSGVTGGGESDAENSGQRFESLNRRFDYDGPLVQYPPIVPGDAAEVEPAASVIGVSIKGRHRAYRIAGMCLVDTHVVNDVVEDVPVTVTYCDLRRIARAFTRSGEPGVPLNARVRGYLDHQGLLIEINGEVVLQESETIPAERLDFELSTWGQWKSAHPDTDIYLGREIDPEAENDRLRNLSIASLGVTLPAVERASRANMHETARVIGVEVGSRHRAYRVLALSDPQSTVVNDVIGKVPVTVTYNHWQDCARAFTKTGETGGPLEVGMRGWKEGQMLLEIDDRIVPQDSGETGLAPVAVEVVSWKDWRAAHPDTDVYTGRQKPRVTEK